MNPFKNPSVIKKATVTSIQRLDESFFRIRFDRLTPREKQYLRALAEFRNSLIKKGMLYSPAHGDTEFTVPLFDEFMKSMIRVMFFPCFQGKHPPIFSSDEPLSKRLFSDRRQKQAPFPFGACQG